LEDKAFRKLRLSVLWLVYECGAITSSIMELWLPGFAEGLIAGELEGIGQITPELILTLTIFLLIPPVMAFLSLTLKNSINRWANIIAGTVFAGGALILGPVIFLAQPSAYESYVILVGIVEFVVAALILWYAWKWPRQEENKD